jgi:hypothetical protein
MEFALKRRRRTLGDLAIEVRGPPAPDRAVRDAIGGDGHGSACEGVAGGGIVTVVLQGEANRRQKGSTWV